MNDYPVSLYSQFNSLADLYASDVITCDEAIKAATKIIKQHERTSSKAMTSSDISGFVSTEERLGVK